MNRLCSCRAGGHLPKVNNLFSISSCSGSLRTFVNAASLSPALASRHNVNMDNLAARKNNNLLASYGSGRRGIHAENPKEMILPSLMNFAPVMWPKITNTIRNWFFTYFVIKPYFDKDFNIQEFSRGAREVTMVFTASTSY